MEAEREREASELDPQALINQYAKQKLGRSIAKVCRGARKRFGNNARFAFWHATAPLFEGAVQESLRELQQLDGTSTLQLAVVAAQLYAHSCEAHADQEAVSSLEQRFDNLEASASTDDLTTTAAFYYLCTNDPFKARLALHMAERVVDNDVDEQAIETRALLGWLTVEVEEYEEEDEDTRERIDRAITYFDSVLNVDPVNIEALMGKAKAYECLEDFSTAEDLLTQLFAAHSWFTPALLEKANLAFIQRDWESVVENCESVLSADKRSFSALRILIIYKAVREGKVQDCDEMLDRLLNAVDNIEPNNATLCCRLAEPLLHLACENDSLLLYAKALTQRACRHAPRSVKSNVMHASILRQRGELKEALEYYKEASRIDTEEGSGDDLRAAYGQVHVQILLGQLNDADEQLDFLLDVESSNKSSYLLYLQALMAYQRSTPSESNATDMFANAVDIHRERLQELRRDVDFFSCKLEPELLKNAAQCLLAINGYEPKQEWESTPRELQYTIKALDFILRSAPGVLCAQQVIARARFLNNELDKALQAATTSLEQNEGQAHMHMLLSQIRLAREEYREAEDALEETLSCSFALRNTPQYTIVKASILLKKNETHEAIRLLEHTVNQVGVRTGSSSTHPSSTSMSNHERCTLSLLLIDAYSKAHRSKDAAKVIKAAEKEFKGTKDELRVTIAKCHFAIERGDAEKAMEQLSSIPRGSPHYLRAKIALADIYLKEQNDTEAYAKTYEEIVELQPNERTYTLYGDALLTIQEPEDAVEAYNTALKMNPRNTKLPSKIGKALVSAHDYPRAVSYYKSATAEHSEGKVELLQELASLQMKLKEHEDAISTLDQALAHNKDKMGNARAMMQDVDTYKLQAKVYMALRDSTQYLEVMRKAYELQRSITSKAGLETEEVQQAKADAAELCYKMAQQYEELRQFSKAMQNLNSALMHDGKHVPSLLSLARLHKARGELGECEDNCSAVLRVESANTEASMMLAELLYQQENFETAFTHFQKILNKNPREYDAMSRLMHLLRCSGKGHDMKMLLQRATNDSNRAKSEAGYAYCAGLEAKYSTRLNEALANFNYARFDARYGQASLYEMVNIYLQPELDALMDFSAERSGEGNAPAAARLLQQISPSDRRYHIVMEQYVRMASHKKEDITGALEELGRIAKEDPEDVRVLLALAVGFSYTKSYTKARNQLKRISKMPYNIAEHDEHERAWLLLADLHLQNGKHDQASEICRRCIKYNRSCALGWELLGHVNEHEHAYEEAARNYEMAWKFDGSLATGYRLAYNLLKAKENVQAINVCHSVLAKDPEYPQIKENILDKARAALRP